MSKKAPIRTLQISVVLLMVVAILVGILASPQADGLAIMLLIMRS